MPACAGGARSDKPPFVRASPLSPCAVQRLPRSLKLPSPPSCQNTVPALPGSLRAPAAAPSAAEASRAPSPAEPAAPACPGRPLLPAGPGPPAAEPGTAGAPQPGEGQGGWQEERGCAERGGQDRGHARVSVRICPGRAAQAGSAGALASVRHPRLSERWREGCFKRAVIKKLFN